MTWCPTPYTMPTQQPWCSPYQHQPCYPTTWTSNYYGQPTYYNTWEQQQQQQCYPSQWSTGNEWTNETMNRPAWWCNNMCNVNFRPTNPIEFHCLTNPIRVLDREGNRQLWLCFDMRGYRAEEMQVTLNRTERCVVIEANHDVKEGKEHQITRRYTRRVCLPESMAKCDLSKCELRSYLTPEGQLTIECCLPKMTTEEIARCPVMSKAVYSPYGYYGFPSTCNTTPVACKTN